MPESLVNGSAIKLVLNKSKLSQIGHLYQGLLFPTQCSHSCMQGLFFGKLTALCNPS